MLNMPKSASAWR